MPNGLRRAVVLGVALTLPLGVRADGPPTQADRLAALVSQLGSPRFEEREAATRALAALGPSALGVLRQAAAGGVAEARRRARLLVRQLERRAEADRLLAPTRPRLRYQDSPLLEAVADLGRRLGAPVTLDGDREKLAE